MTREEMLAEQMKKAQEAAKNQTFMFNEVATPGAKPTQVNPEEKEEE